MANLINFSTLEEKKTNGKAFSIPRSDRGEGDHLDPPHRPGFTMPTKKVAAQGRGREEGGEVVIERRRHLSWPKRDDDPCAHACRPCGIGLSVCQCERRQLTRSRRRACRGPSDVTSCPLASRDLVWTTAHQGTQKVRASSMFGRRKLSQTVVWHVI